MNTTMRRNLFAAVIALGGSLAVHTAAAAVITLTPSSITTTTGNAVAVDVSVSALGSGVALGGFDLDIAFNPALLSPSAVAFGPLLGNPTFFEALTSFSFATLGIVDFSEVSLLAPAELAALQPASFSIATLSFNAIASGTTGFLLVGTSTLSDAFGNALPISQPAAVPEPGSILLLGLGIAGLMLVRKRHGRHARLPQQTWLPS